MAAITAGRSTHAFPDHLSDLDEVVVFLIGCRVNRLRAVRSWWPVVTAMPRMLSELSHDTELGLLSYSMWMSGRSLMVAQYWRSLDHLYAYAQATDLAHRPAWAAFNRRVREHAGDVGIFHETYVVPTDRIETFYGDMPPTGLAAATSAVPITPARHTARQRMGACGPS